MKRIALPDFWMGGSCIFLCLVTMLLNWQSPVARALIKEQRIMGLLMGSDYEDNTRHSDTIMFVSYDPQSRFLDVLSVPRDTQVTIPQVPHIRRINEVFAYEYKRSGKNFDIASLATKSVVETLLSSGTAGNLQIPFYFTIDYDGFKNLIDALGGLYIRVTEPMNYDDNWGHLHIHFTPGVFLMNGHSALLYVRYRGANADQGRVLRQQIFVKEVLKRLSNPMALIRLPHYAQVLLEGLHTNFTRWDMVVMILEGRHVRWKNLRLFSLPGAPNGVLWKMNPDGAHQILTMMQSPAPRGRAAMPANSREPLESRGAMTVEVWNASNQPNVARAVVQLLRDHGFDVVVFGNFSTRQQRTLVIDRSGRLRPAQAVAEVLRDVNPEVVSRVDLTRQVDVSVILGNDANFAEPKRWGWH